MQYLLAWQTLVFLVPLLFGVALVGGFALGLVGGGDADSDAHAEADTHADADAEHDAHPDHAGALHGGPVHDFLSALGVGRVPLSIVLLTLSLLFGATGLAGNALLSARLPEAYGLVSLPLALFIALFATGQVTRAVARVAPTLETYRVRRRDFVGRTGRALFEITERDGFAQLSDHEGNLQQVRCRSARGSLPKGATVLVLEHHPDGDYFVVEPFDPDAALPASEADRTARATRERSRT